MDLVDGEDLSRRLARGPLSEHDGIRIVLDVASAIRCAHEEKVLHCDLKPSNVLMARDGRAVVSDSGLARLMRIDPMIDPWNDAPVGTPAYMAPEQWDASLGEIGVAADVYGIGGILYAAFSSHAPRAPLAADRSLADM